MSKRDEEIFLISEADLTLRKPFAHFLEPHTRLPGVVSGLQPWATCASEQVDLTLFDEGLG